MSNDNPNNNTTSTSTFSSSQQQQQQQQFYFCYQCNRTISIAPISSSSELVCPNCNGGFLEEVENPNPNPTSHFPFPPFLSPPQSSSSSAADQLAPFAPLLFPQSSSPPQIDPIDLSSIFGVNNPRSPFQDSDVFNPFQFLQNYLQTMRAGGANIQFVIENANPDQIGVGIAGGGGGAGGGNVRLPSNLGDYFFGPGLEQLIQQLAENDPNRYGTPPASKTAVEALPSVKVDEELLSSDSSQCAVCMDEFKLGAEAKQMPCKHVFHGDCILPWLELHNSCPVCRHELPTDDPEYEQRARGRRENPGSDGNGNGNGNGNGSGNGGGGGNGSGNVDGGVGDGSQNDRTVERRFRIQLPWPFRGTAEGSTTSSGDGSDSTRRRENPDFGSETRQEDLD